MVAGKVQHWKHGWIPISPEAKLMLAARRETKHEVIRATVVNQKVIDREFADMGLPENHPMRGVLNRVRGSHFAVARDKATGAIVGGIAMSVRGGDVSIEQMRVMDDSKRGGIGTELIRQAARQVGPRGELKVYGAVSSAKPFYAKTGATFWADSTLGTWSPEAVAALKAGTVPPPGIVHTAESQFTEQLAREQVEYPDWYRERYGNLTPAQAAKKYGRNT